MERSTDHGPSEQNEMPHRSMSRLASTAFHFLLMVLLGACLLAIPRAASGRSSSRPTPKESPRPWEQMRLVADLVVVGESLQVSLTDPRGRQDAWNDGQRRSRIPDCRSFTGPMKTGPATEPKQDPIYQTWLRLYPTRGAYVLSVSAPRRATPAVVFAMRPYLPECRQHDSVTVEAGATVRWRVLWGMNETLDSCRTELTRLTPKSRAARQ